MRKLHSAPGLPIKGRGAFPLCFLLLAALASCLSHHFRPYGPVRPFTGPDGRGFTLHSGAEPFPERWLTSTSGDSLTNGETPARTLVRIEEIFRQIGSITRPEPEWRLKPVRQEISTIAKGIAELGIGAGTLLRQAAGKLRPEEVRTFRKASGFSMRWGLSLMRTGEVNQRVWGAEKLRQAVEWDPGNPIPVLVLAAYDELAGYWSNELDLCDGFTKDYGHHDLIDLKVMRGREHAFKVFREREQLDRALAICADLMARNGGRAGAPAWLYLEKARLLYLADSTAASLRAAVTAVQTAGTSSADTLTTVQADLLLGVLWVRQFEFQRAQAVLQAAVNMAAQYAPLQNLASVMSVPWDLWSDAERAEFDFSPDRAGFVARFWKANDAILATPDLEEDLIEYERRVGEAWFLLQGVDPTQNPLFTDPAQAILRFGRPLGWIAGGGESVTGLARPGAGLGVLRTWRLGFRVAAEAGPSSSQVPGSSPLSILFHDSGSASRFVAADSLRGSRYPFYSFSDPFGEKRYRCDYVLARLRGTEGRTQLLLLADTYLPDYSINQPMQGIRFEGDASVHSALYVYRGGCWTVGRQVTFPLNRETRISRERTFRRRAGSISLGPVERGTVRVASMLSLRDLNHRGAAMAADNGEPTGIDEFAGDHLEASDLLLLSSLGDSLPPEKERTLRPGVVIHGPDWADSRFVPLAGRMLLQGEDLAFYLEVYNLNISQKVTEAELAVGLERLREDGTTDYAVILRGQSMNLVRYRVSQWNIARTVTVRDLPLGRYRLQVLIFDRRADARIQRVAEFQVVRPEELIESYGLADLKPPPQE